MMTDQNDFANARAFAAFNQFSNEACSITGIVNEKTFDELIDAFIENRKANIDASNLPEDEKNKIKASVELEMRLKAKLLKGVMINYIKSI